MVRTNDHDTVVHVIPSVYDRLERVVLTAKHPGGECSLSTLHPRLLVYEA